MYAPHYKITIVILTAIVSYYLMCKQRCTYDRWQICFSDILITILQYNWFCFVISCISFMLLKILFWEGVYIRECQGDPWHNKGLESTLMASPCIHSAYIYRLLTRHHSHVVKNVRKTQLLTSRRVRGWPFKYCVMNAILILYMGAMGARERTSDQNQGQGWPLRDDTGTKS